MNLSDVKNQLLVIEANKNDDERAHSMIDDLYRGVLETIAEQDSNELAIEALKAEKIHVQRWCA